MSSSAAPMPLAGLLESIGAAPLDPLAAIRTGEARIAEHVAHLEDAKRTAEARVEATVRKEWPKLREQYETSGRLGTRISSQREELGALEHDFDDPELGVLPTLTSALTTHSALVDSRTRSTALLAALVTLSPIFASLSKLSALLRTESPAALVDGVAVLTRLRDDVLRLVNPELAGEKSWVAQSELAKRARTRADELGEETRQRLLDAIRTAVVVLPGVDGALSPRPQGDGPRGILVARILSSQTPQPRAVTWSDALEALGRISPADVDREVARSAAVTVRVIAGPLCHRDSALRLRRTEAPGQGTELRLVPLEPTAASGDAPLRTLDDLRVLLTALAEALPFKAYLRLLHAHLLPQLEALVVNHVLSSALPASPEDAAGLVHWSTRIYPAARHFCATVIGRTPHPSPAPTPDGKPKPLSMARWLDTVGHQWGILLASRALDAARKQVAECKWEGTSVEWELPPEPVPPPQSVPSPPRTQARPSLPPVSTTTMVSVDSGETGGSFRSLFDFQAASSPSPSPSLALSTRSPARSEQVPVAGEAPASSSQKHQARASVSRTRLSRASTSSPTGSRPALPQGLFTPSPSPSPPASPTPTPPPPALSPEPEPDSSFLSFDAEPAPEAPDETVDWDMGVSDLASPPPALPTHPVKPSPRHEPMLPAPAAHPILEARPAAPSHKPPLPRLTTPIPTPQLPSEPEHFGDEAAPVDQDEDPWGLDDQLDDDQSVENALLPPRLPSVATSKPAASSSHISALSYVEPALPRANGTAHSQSHAAAHAPPPAEVSFDDDAGGAWGFGDEEHPLASEPPRPPMAPPARSPAHDPAVAPKSQPPADESSFAVDDADGWGFGDDDVEAGEATSSPMRLRGGAGSDEGDGDAWGWDEDEEDEDAAVEAQLRGTAPPAAAERTRAKPQATPEAGSGAPRMEEMTISKLAVDILVSAQGLLKQSQRVAEPAFESRELAPAAPILAQTAFDLFDLFAGIMPVQHSQLLETVPSLGMQFANDCEWLAKRVRSLRKGERPEQTGKRLEKLAKVTRERQVDIQKAALAECLADAEGFRDTGDAARFAACERAIKQVKHTLERVSQAWKPVMLPSAFLTSLGDLVSTVLGQILADIESQADIGEVESQKLNVLCKSLHGLDSLFKVGETSTIGRHVPEWFKYCFLSELLEASMADIMWMHGEGLLSEYSDREVVNLIQALFSESPLRTKNIDKILAAGARGT